MHRNKSVFMSCIHQIIFDSFYLLIPKNLPVDDDKCLYFKHDLKYLSRSGHVIDDVMFLFWSLKYYQVKHYFPVNIHCCVAKRQLSTVLGPVFRLFLSYLFPASSPVNCKCLKSLVISVLCPTSKTSIMLLFSTQ